MKIPFSEYIFKHFIDAFHILSINLSMSNITKLQWFAYFAKEAQSTELMKKI